MTLQASLTIKCLAHEQELNEQKDALLSKVATLKKELQDWRTKLDTQVKTYRAVRLERSY
jgi:uncharacterized coiled-coil DUF342 family protein